MKFKLTTLIVLVLLPLLSLAQGSSLTIFSEDGDKFILFLNGSQQNGVSQANLRLDGLTQPYYKARIVFDDKNKAAIDKSIGVVEAATNAPSDVVYKIKNKDGEMKLRFYSMQPVQQNYTPPADVHVVHYGQPDQVITTTQTTVTTTGGGNGGAGITINSGAGTGNGGVSIGVNMNPDMNGGMTQATTTTTTSQSSSSYGNGYSQQAAQPGCQYPMEWPSFKSAKQTVEQATFEDTKLSSAKAILSSNCFSCEQVVQICQLFTFEETKLKFAKFAYAKTTDQGNYFKVANVFTFDGSKTDLNNFIANGGR